MKMLLYTLSVGQYDSYHLEGIFSSSEEAHVAAAEASKIWGHAEVEEVHLDNLVGVKAIAVWNSTIDLATGELLKNQYKGDHRERKQFIWENDKSAAYKIDAKCLIDMFNEISHVGRSQVVYSKEGLADARKKAKKLRNEFICGIDLNTAVVSDFGIYPLVPEKMSEGDKFQKLTDFLT